MITHYCIIRNFKINVDGTTVFSGPPALEDFLMQAYSAIAFDYPKFFKMDNMSKLGVLAAEFLVRSIKFQLSTDEVAVVLSNSESSLDTDRRFLKSAEGVASPALFVYTLPNIVIGEICIRHKFKGENVFFVTEKFNAKLIAENADMALENGATTCLAGWVDVLGDQHDVFLYLLQKGSSQSVEPSAETLDKLYNSTLWTT